MFRITRFRLAVVLLVVVGAFFIDGYSLIYRYLVVHQPLGQTLTPTPTLPGARSSTSTRALISRAAPS